MKTSWTSVFFIFFFKSCIISTLIYIQYAVDKVCHVHNCIVSLSCTNKSVILPALKFLWDSLKCWYSGYILPVFYLQHIKSSIVFKPVVLDKL